MKKIVPWTKLPLKEQFEKTSETIFIAAANSPEAAVSALKNRIMQIR